MSIRVIVFGATGMVGEGVLHEALKHPAVESILVIGRRSCNILHPKISEMIHDDFFDYAAIEHHLVGFNACFFCLGVSSLRMREQEYTRLTYDLTMQAATTLSRLNPEMTFCYISGAGTDATERGRSMWARVKGKTENDLSRLPFKAVYLFRPGFIKPTKGLKNTFVWARILGLAYPAWKILLAKYVCTLEELGLAMIRAADKQLPKKILECKDIALLAGESKVPNAGPQGFLQD
jgi:uncharacterized protein YbjT (DUF2867 family)